MKANVPIPISRAAPRSAFVALGMTNPHIHTRRLPSHTMGEDTRNSLMRCTIANLRERCAELGLDGGGIKADLVDRLLERKVAPAPAAAPAAATAPDVALDVADDDDDVDERNDVEMVAVGDAQSHAARGEVEDEFLEHCRTHPSDSAAMERLARLARASTIPSARAMFDALTDAFPRSSLLWQWYIDAELTRNESGETDDETIRAIFGKCLIPCPSALLWRKYCAYMASTQDTKTEEGVATMKSVYEYSVDVVGEDADAADVWLDYVRFLRSADATLIVTDVRPEQAESARDVIVRRCFQRAITVPMNKLDVVYKEYEAFENEKNKALARALLQDLAPKLVLTRTAVGKRKKALDGIVVGAVCVNPVQRGADGAASIVCAAFNKGACRGCTRMHECKFCGSPSHGANDCSSKEYALLANNPSACAAQWAAVIELEKSNPQKLEGATPGEQSQQLFNRIKHTYELAGLSLGETPEFWLEYANWHESERRVDDAAEVLQRARDALPYCALLTFAAADLEEARDDAEACKKIYETVLDEYETTAAEAVERGEESTMPREVVLMYCEYVRACRRVEDQASSRKAFMRARKQPGCPWEVYATAAMLEWQYDKSDKPARNIFELGLKHFLSSPQYVERYAEFLTGVNDVANARVLFERAIEDSPSREVWDLFVTFERAHGTHETIRKAESRRNAAFKATDVKVNLLDALLGRHTVMDLRPATADYCDYFASLGAVVPLRRVETSHISYATLRSERLARAAVAAAVPPPIAPAGAPKVGKAAAPPAPPSGMKKLPGALGKFFASLPGPVAFAKFPPPRVEAVLDALKATDLSEEAIQGYLSRMGYKGGEKRKAIELIDDPALAASRTAASAKPPVKDVFRARQSKMQRAQAEYQ